MKVFTFTGFVGHWPVGTAAVVVAENQTGAVAMLERVLREQDLALGTPSIQEIDLTKPSTHVLLDGNY